MRGFGAPQAILTMENVIIDVANFLGIRPDEVRLVFSICVLSYFYGIFVVIKIFLKVMQQALSDVVNCYHIRNFRAVGHVCKTNLPSSTAMRGFGVPQAILIMENVINDVANFLGIRTDKVGLLFSITACAVATNCCISDVSSEWEGAIFDPRSSKIWGAIDLKLKTKKQALGPPHMSNMVKIGLGVWAGPIPSLSPPLGYPSFVCFFTARC